jgi:6-phosphofructokinase 2
MKPIVTVTLSPSLDGDSETDVIRPTHKIRTSRTRFYPAGGGVNVARVITELGGVAIPVYCSGGPTGAILDRLLGSLGLEPHPIRIAGDTRVSNAVFERSTGREYRFVPEGPDIGAEEVAQVLKEVDALEFDWLVASGSLPASLPADTFASIGRHATARGARFVLDTSGPALAKGLASDVVYLVKPSIGELRALTGQALANDAEIAAAAQALRAEHGVALVAVTLGEDGALLAGPDGVLRLPAARVPVQSATGAGDSFLGAMVFALSEGRSAEAAFALATAAGAAAVLTYGTDLCHRADVMRLHAAHAA